MANKAITKHLRHTESRKVFSLTLHKMKRTYNSDACKYTYPYTCNVVRETDSALADSWLSFLRYHSGQTNSACLWMGDEHKKSTGQKRWLFRFQLLGLMAQGKTKQAGELVQTYVSGEWK